MPFAMKRAQPAYKKPDKVKPWQRLYNRQAWRRLSQQFRRGRLCSYCLAEGQVTPCEVVHHKQKHEGNEALMFDPSNLMGLCKLHHDRRTLKGE